MNADDSTKQKVSALSILIAGKVVDENILNKVYSEVKLMYSDNVILKVAEKFGAEQEKEEIAIKMLAKNVDLLDVIEFTGLSIDRIRELRQNVHGNAILA